MPKRNFTELNNFQEKITPKSFTLKGIVMNHILSPINEYNSEPVNIGEVCVQGILLQEEGVEAGGEELSSDPVEVGQEAGQLISQYS